MAKRTYTKGQPGGYCGLDEAGMMPMDHAPADLARVADVAYSIAAAIAAHLAASDPHPQYLTPSEGAAAFDALGTSAAGIAAHVAAADPHPQYLTAAEGAAAFDAIGAATAVVVAHEAAGNPHPQYLTQAEGDAAYDAIGAAAAAQAASAPLVHATRHQAGGADPIKLDDLAAPDDNTDLNASTTAHGLLQKLPGGTSTFLRGDGAFAAPPGGGGGIAAMAVAVVVAYGSQYAEAVVVDANISAASKILIGWGNPTDADVNTPDMDGVSFGAIPASGQMTVRLSANTPIDRLGGPYKLLYQVAT